VQTLTHLAGVELVAGGIVLVVLALAAAAVLTVSLRPLRRIAETADAIAAIAEAQHDVFAARLDCQFVARSRRSSS